MDTKDTSVNNINEPCCPKCGSKNLEDTSGTEVAKAVGKVTGRIAIELLDVPLRGFLKQAAGRSASFMGEQAGKMIYHRVTCQKCGFTGWASEFEH